MTVETDRDRSRRELLAELERKYIWFEPVGAARHSEERILSQAMDLGTYDDILRIEDIVGRAALAAVMQSAAPGAISDRSWEFWRGRLTARGFAVADRPPRRRFDAARGPIAR